MKGYLEILAEEGLGKLSKEQHDALNVIRKANMRLEKLIEDLIQFSLASRGELSLNIETHNLNELVAKAVEGVISKSQAKDITLSDNLAKCTMDVNCDGEKIHWVISQLLDNAIKFTSTGGVVEVKTSCLEETATVIITDTGIGIPPERMDELFLPFHQLDGSATRRYGGTGVGLALCSRIIEAHGSSIRVKSVVGEGSTFMFSLPIVRRL
jgi:signal transduction histidine kinase